MLVSNPSSITVDPESKQLVGEASDLGLKGWPLFLEVNLEKVVVFRRMRPEYYQDDLAGMIYREMVPNGRELLVIND